MNGQVKSDGCALYKGVPLWEKIVMQCLPVTCPSCREEHGQEKRMCAHSTIVLSLNPKLLLFLSGMNPKTIPETALFSCYFAGGP